MLIVLEKKYKLIILTLVMVAVAAIIYFTGKTSPEQSGESRVDLPQSFAGESEMVLESGRNEAFKADDEPFTIFVDALNAEKPIVLYFFSRT